MIFSIVYLILLVGGFGCLMYFADLYTKWYFYFIPLVGIPVGYVILFGLTLLFFVIVAKFINIDKDVKKPSKIARFIVNQMNHLTIVLSLTKVKYKNFKGFNKKQPCMIIYNHISNFDPMLIMNKVHRLICITKYGNKKIPGVGGMIHKAGYITIDREHNDEGIKAINKAIEYLENGVASICVAPEGTRSKDLKLLPFHPGTFNIAKRSGVPIVCVLVKNTNMIHKNFPKKITKCECNIIYTMKSEEYAELSTVEIASRLHDLYAQYIG